MPKIIIDGKEYEFKEGETILNVAWRNGIKIPVFCYHPKLPPAASCRVCNVLVKTPRGERPMPSCVTPAQDGMEVIFNDPRVQNTMQKGVVELLLLNHPLECPTCDAGGECDLQEITYEYGPTESRNEFPKRIKEKKDAGPFLDLYPNRCIECDRCERFYWKIGGGNDWGAYNRGWWELFGVWKDHLLQNEFSGNLAEVCPLGAINSKDYRFKARPWEIEAVESIAPDDSIGANIFVNVRRKYPLSRGPFIEGGRRRDLFKVYRIQGRDNPDVNDFWLSDRDRFSHSWVSSSDRIPRTLIREEGGFEEKNWDYVLDRLYQDMKDVPSDQIAVLTGARSSNESAFVARKLFKDLLGVSNIDFRHVSAAHEKDPVEEVFGYSVSTGTIKDIDDAENIIAFGVDIKNSFPTIGIRLIAASRRGASFYVFHTYREKYIKERWARGIVFHPDKLEEYAHKLGKFLETGEGLDIDLKEGKTLLILPDDLPYSALRNILYGSLFRENVRVLLLRHRPNAQGFIDMGFYGGNTYDILKRAAEGQIKVLFLWQMEPLIEFPDRNLVEKALRNTPVVVHISPFADVSYQFAKYVLPETTIFEENGLRTNTEGRVQVHRYALWNYEDSMPAWWIFQSLARRFGEDFGFADERDIRKAIKDEVSSYSNVSFSLKPNLRKYADWIPSIRKVSRYYVHDVADYTIVPQKAGYIEPKTTGNGKGDKILLYSAPHIFKSGYYSFRSSIFYPYVKDYLKTVEMNSYSARHLGVSEGDEITVGDVSLKVRINDDLVDGSAVVRTLYYDSEINRYLNINGRTLIEKK